MSLQTQIINCLACHILAKHPQFTKNNKVYNLTSFKTKKTIINQVSLPTTLTDKIADTNTNSSIKNQLRKIA